jgi:Family of unknown function (DUF5678)
MKRPRATSTATDQPTSPPARSAAQLMDHQDSVDWLARHPEALNEYLDEWVALVGHEIVGHGPTMTDALRAARERGYADPLLVPVMPPEIEFAD